MRVILERFERYAVDVILERREGGRANALKFVLGGFSKIYERAVQTRLGLYRRRIFRPQNSDVRLSVSATSQSEERAKRRSPKCWPASCRDVAGASPS